jgi:hypothetical protein
MLSRPLSNLTLGCRHPMQVTMRDIMRLTLSRQQRLMRLSEASTTCVPSRRGGGYAADVNYAIGYVFDVYRNEDLKRRARNALKIWHYQFGRESFGGPSFQVWARTRSLPTADDVCTEVSIAFRGTAGLWDWVSNFHPITGYFVDTYYYQLQRNIDGIINSIKDLDCYKRASIRAIKTKIVSTGHSLGGGLAQFAALANKNEPRITKVFAFDPSPITGASLIAEKVRSENATGLAIDRIYQTGEVLAAARGLVQQFPSSKSRCDPFVRTVRIDAIPADGAIQLHGMPELAAQVVQLSYDRKGALKDYVTPSDPNPSKCKLRYSPPTSDEELIASASRSPAGYAFVPNYRGYQDRFAAWYPPAVQQSRRMIKLSRATVQRMAMVSDERLRKKIRFADPYSALAQVGNNTPLPPGTNH